MKTLFLCAALLSATAQAAPDCWTIDGTPTGTNGAGAPIADGEFLISVNTDAVTKENLLLILQKVHFGNLDSSDFPIFIQNSLIFTVTATSGKVPPPMDRTALKQQVAGQIDEIAAIPGVQSVDCNGLNKPMP